MYTTYILYSSKLNKYYTGQTIDLHKRIEEHNRGKTRFSASGLPWILVFSKNFESRSEAIMLENKIKKRGAERFLNDINFAVGWRMAPQAPGPSRPWRDHPDKK
jgi:putative endonuclease